jgi:hypothetical protein
MLCSSTQITRPQWEVVVVSGDWKNKGIEFQAAGTQFDLRCLPKIREIEFTTRQRVINSKFPLLKAIHFARE